jgi:cell wall integrity and stress response component
VATLPRMFVVSLIKCFLDFWPYQSNGECTDHCKASGTWAFAVIQFNDCWCSNYIPSTTTDISDCQKNCPGYPSEKCGDKDAGLYIYIEMAGQPSGTAGGGSQPSSTSMSSAAPVPSSTDSPSSDAVTVSTSMFHYIASFCYVLHILHSFL